MAMGWLKGLVAPAAFGESAQAPLPGVQQQPGGPPIGGMPSQDASPYGVQPPYGAPPQMPPQGTPPIGVPNGAGGGPAPYDASALPNAMQWSTGTRTQGAAQAASAGISGGSSGGLAGGSAEARIAELQHDVDSLALFARTLLTMLEDSKVVTRAQFDATKSRLDMLDGKLDDR
jgi:hypothetical protein